MVDYGAITTPANSTKRRLHAAARLSTEPDGIVIRRGGNENNHCKKAKRNDMALKSNHPDINSGAKCAYFPGKRFPQDSAISIGHDQSMSEAVLLLILEAVVLTDNQYVACYSNAGDNVFEDLVIGPWSKTEINDGSGIASALFHSSMQHEYRRNNCAAASPVAAGGRSPGGVAHRALLSSTTRTVRLFIPTPAITGQHGFADRATPGRNGSHHIRSHAANASCKMNTAGLPREMSARACTSSSAFSPGSAF